MIFPIFPPRQTFRLTSEYEELFAIENLPYYSRLFFQKQGLPEDQEDSRIEKNYDFILKQAKLRACIDIEKEIDKYQNKKEENCFEKYKNENEGKIREKRENNKSILDKTDTDGIVKDVNSFIQYELQSVYNKKKRIEKNEIELMALYEKSKKTENFQDFCYGYYDRKQKEDWKNG